MLIYDILIKNVKIYPHRCIFVYLVICLQETHQKHYIRGDKWGGMQGKCISGIVLARGSPAFARASILLRLGGLLQFLHHSLHFIVRSKLLAAAARSSLIS